MSKASGKGRGFTDQAVSSYVKRQHLSRWPDQETEDRYNTLNREKKVRRPDKPIKPAPSGFKLFDMLDGEDLDRLMLAASLKVKRVRRAPGWVIVKVYNLKDRPLVLI